MRTIKRWIWKPIEIILAVILVIFFFCISAIFIIPVEIGRLILRISVPSRFIVAIIVTAIALDLFFLVIPAIIAFATIVFAYWKETRGRDNVTTLEVTK